MPYSVELFEEAKYVKVIVTGELDRAGHEAGRDAVIRALETSGLSKLLVDARQSTAQMSVLEDYEFMKQNQETPLRAVQMALVYAAEESERFGFLEDVAINRSANLRIFTDPDSALEWLLGTGKRS